MPVDEKEGTQKLPVVRDLGALTHLYSDEDTDSLKFTASLSDYVFWDPSEKRWYREDFGYTHLVALPASDLRQLASKNPKQHVLVGPIFVSPQQVEQYALYEKLR